MLNLYLEVKNQILEEMREANIDLPTMAQIQATGPGSDLVNIFIYYIELWNEQTEKPIPTAVLACLRQRFITGRFYRFTPDELKSETIETQEAWARISNFLWMIQPQEEAKIVKLI